MPDSLYILLMIANNKAVQMSDLHQCNKVEAGIANFLKLQVEFKTT
jgi:hypothetical protein